MFRIQPKIYFSADEYARFFISQTSFKLLPHQQDGKSAARVFHQVATWVPYMFCNFYLTKSFKIANNSASIEARAKISIDL
jgi:hypothetical protein